MLPKDGSPGLAAHNSDIVNRIHDLRYWEREKARRAEDQARYREQSAPQHDHGRGHDGRGLQHGPTTGAGCRTPDGLPPPG